MTIVNKTLRKTDQLILAIEYFTLQCLKNSAMFLWHFFANISIYILYLAIAQSQCVCNLKMIILGI